ncbi:MAG: hypothetical protein LIP03_11685 [Bacteroidales bacterium]|nr:hypothetical protein [Bacteroidales bacterium]
MERLISALLIAIVWSFWLRAEDANVMDFGARADTLGLSSEAFQRAIDYCSETGGGTVTVPPGEYLCASVMLKDNVRLRLAEGATVYASRRCEDYATLPRGAGDMPEAQFLIGAVGAKGIAIEGPGQLHGRAHRVTYQREPFTTLHDSITGREVQNAALSGADYHTKWRKVAPYTSGLYLIDCEDVELKDFTITEANGWSAHLQWCRNVEVSGLNIYSNPHNGVNADGLDIDGCQGVKVWNCHIDTGDDALCLKTTRVNGRTEPCSDVEIWDCWLRSSSAALKLGTESHADFQRILAHDCVIEGANRGLNMIIRDGGKVSDVTFRDMTVRCERKETFWWGNGDPVWLIVYRRPEAESAGSIDGVTFENIQCQGMSGIRGEAFDGPISNVTFKNVSMTMVPEPQIDKRACHGWHFEGLDRLTLDGVSMRWDAPEPQPQWQLPYSFKSIKNLTIK